MILKLNKKLTFRVVNGLFSALLFLLVIKYVDWKGIAKLLSEINFNIFFLAACAYAATGILRAYLLAEIGSEKITPSLIIQNFFNISWTQLASQLIPFKLGEFVYPYLTRHTGVRDGLIKLLVLRLSELVASILVSALLLLMISRKADVILIAGFLVVGFTIILITEKKIKSLSETLFLHESKVSEEKFWSLTRFILTLPTLRISTAIAICAVQFIAFWLLAISISNVGQPFLLAVLFFVATIANILPFQLLAGIGMRQIAIVPLGFLVGYQSEKLLVESSVVLQLLIVACLFFTSAISSIVSFLNSKNHLFTRK